MALPALLNVSVNTPLINTSTSFIRLPSSISVAVINSAGLIVSPTLADICVPFFRAITGFPDSTTLTVPVACPFNTLP
ncbi:hypothetical protein B4086_5818 [Bacillus cereus]|nr:hypothetical protein B4086_5818 [Bacillus cereus]